MSGVLQTAPHYPTSVPALHTPPLNSASPSNRQYPSSRSSPTQEGPGYHANQQYPGASPASSSRHPSRAPSGAANDYQVDTNPPMSSRAAVASPGPVPVSAGATSASSNPPYSPSSSQRKQNMPTAVPPRTSSSRRAQTSDRASESSSRRVHGESSRDANGRVDPNDESRSRRVSNQAGSQYDPRANPSAPAPVRSPPANSASGKGPSREASEILNSILISQPEVDIERERERLAQAQPQQTHDDEAAPPPVVAPTHNGDDARRGGRSRHDHSKREKQTKFGDYILGNTIGEGEFGKVKLGWKPDGGVQVAIKLIKKDQLGSNPSRMAKIMREVAILKQLTHPNIVRLHKMEESERHYGIVLEYASGGELFDYILNHRYLKDNAARRLFAQLVSGVGYLHKKGIVHRDLKLENLLLDRNRNIIITDFGFANTFDPSEDLTEDEELNLTDREFVKRMGLDKIKPSTGSRKGDLMQTSCGSPCYAAPELVVSDSLYTGRKVDVWSCGVILYAMLAGYLPFDDDPANPEGDNINLLYKYIVNTPLTFPEYVTPHARDLLRRILVPNPRKRADLFEVARHSWLSEYAHVVEFITSSTTTPGEIQNTTVPSEDDGPGMVRSSSVRETSKKAPAQPAIGGLATKQGNIDDAEAAYKQQRDNKRRTVQVEYVAPNTTTQRGEPSTATQSSNGRSHARSGSQGPVEVGDHRPGSSSSPQEKPLPRDPPVAKDVFGKPPVSSRRPPSAHRNVNSAAVAVRTGRDTRATSDTAFFASGGPASNARPATGGSVQSLSSRQAGSQSSYGQPAPPELADTNVHGRIQQPPSRGKNAYGVSSTGEQQNVEYGRPSISAVPPKFARVSGFEGAGAGAAPGVDASASGGPTQEAKGHKRSSTMSEISGKLFGRSGSLFGGRKKRLQEQSEKNKRYPPVSMNNALPTSDEPRTSMDSKRSRRSFSIGLGNKRSGSISGSQNSQPEKQNRRFSFMPTSLSFRSIGIGKDEPSPALDSQQDLPIQEPPTADQYGRYPDQDLGHNQVDANTLDGMYAQLQGPESSNDRYGNQQQYLSAQYSGRPSNVEGYVGQSRLNAGSDSSVENIRRPAESAPQLPQLSYQDGPYDGRRVASGGRSNRGVLQKNKRFVDAWDTDSNSRAHDHSGSSGSARKVMDFFRRRGKARTGELN